MPKLNLFHALLRVFLALMIFAHGAGFVFGVSENVANKQTEDAKNKVEFEVGLQTPFSRPPESTNLKDGFYELSQKGFDCLNDSDGIICFKEGDSEAWRFYPAPGDSGEGTWQQVIRGNDGNEFLQYYASILYKWLAGFIGIMSVLMVVLGGVQIITAGANQEGLQKGKDRIIAALAGLTLLFLSSLLLHTINPTFFTM